jgi:hypothetical protein
MKSLNSCIDIGSGVDVAFSKNEKGKTFTLKSKSNEAFGCKLIDIDGCVFGDDEIKRSDWLFLVEDRKFVAKPRAYYVELKGINIDEASEQLYNAIDRTKSQIPNFDIEARVVSPKGSQPEIINSEYYRKVKRLIKKEIEFCKVHKKNRFTHVEKI